MENGDVRVQNDSATSPFVLVNPYHDAIICANGCTRLDVLIIQPNESCLDALGNLRTAPADKLFGKQFIETKAAIRTVDDDLHYLAPVPLIVQDVELLGLHDVDGKLLFENLDMLRERLVYSQLFVPCMPFFAFVDGKAVDVFSVGVVTAYGGIGKADGFSAVFAMAFDAADGVNRGLQRPVKLDGMHILHLTSR